MKAVAAKSRLLAFTIVKIFAAFGLCLWTVTQASSGAPEPDIEAGESFYRTGLNRNNEALPVTVQGDVFESSERFNCASCHRPSGFGGSEGGEYVPTITGPVLFGATDKDLDRRNRHFNRFFKDKHPSKFDVRVRLPRMRPAYTQATLGRALREGVDAAGQPLSASMPRYQLDEDTLADLSAYLETLSVAPSPGVSDDTLHLATIVSTGVPPEERAAVLDTIRAFTQWYNEDIRGQMAHPGFSPSYRSDFQQSFRQWKMHVWELRGGPETWTAQLQKYYSEQPVFAVVSGLVDGPWQTVDAFCEDQALPCVFPNTELPNLDGAENGNSIYFSRGLTLEAEALARWLSQQPNIKTVCQLTFSQPEGTVPARAFQQAMKNQLPNVDLLQVNADSKTSVTKALAAAALEPMDVLIIWPGSEAQAVIDALNANPPSASMIVLPSFAMSAAQESLSSELMNKVRVTFPYEQPTAYHPRQYRVWAWFRTRRIPLDYVRLQLQTFYTMTEVQFAVDDLINDFYRDFLIENIERLAEAKLNPGIYPSLALGPGQRFASKGAFIMALEPGEGLASYHPVSDWIVP